MCSNMTPFGPRRNVTYFKRFRMEMDLRVLPPVPVLPDDCAWVAWHDDLLPVHAEVLYSSFHEETDALVFPSLGDWRGCLHLMTEIRRKPGFLPAATWLLTSPAGSCGSVQGVRERRGLGAIQNLGVTSPQRGRGLGTALLLKALHGFRHAGLMQAFLEVTAQNDSAVQLYHRIGFRRRKTIYKAVDSASGPPSPQPIDGRLLVH